MTTLPWILLISAWPTLQQSDWAAPHWETGGRLDTAGQVKPWVMGKPWVTGRPESVITSQQKKNLWGGRGLVVWCMER